MKIETLEDLLVDELKDIYSAENQLIKALPKMAKAAELDELRKAFEEHLEQTRVHVKRIEQICEDMGIKPGGKKCMGMQGLIEEGNEIVKADAQPEPLEAGLIGAAQRVEHYEIAAYGTARAHARQLGMMKIADILGQTLEEEKETNQRLTDLAENAINVQAAMTTSNH
jgi:ferritin-like metal-binding protein YciE